MPVYSHSAAPLNYSSRSGRPPVAAKPGAAASMITAPSPASVALLLGLSFFLGLAFEDFFAHADERRPGGIRTFPMLALAGGMLYLLDPAHFIPFTGGFVVLGAWLVVYYRAHVAEHMETTEPNAGSSFHCSMCTLICSAPSPWRCRHGSR